MQSGRWWPLAATAVLSALTTACGSTTAAHHADRPTAESSAQRATSSAPAQPPAAGTVLATVSNLGGDGTQVLLSNAQGQGFTTAVDGSPGYLRAYDAGGEAQQVIPAGDGLCAQADVISPVGRLLVTENDVTSPAQGVNPATSTVSMSAYNVTGKRLWTSILADNAQNDPGCSLAATDNGQWGVWQSDISSASAAVDLSNGKVYPTQNLWGVLGNWVVAATAIDQDNTVTAADLVTPGTWAVLGQLTLGDGNGSPLGMLNEFAGADFAGDPVLARAGAQFFNDTLGTPNDAVITPDDSVLVAYSGNVSFGTPENYVAYSLPGLTKLWSIPAPSGDSPSVAATSNSEVILTENLGQGTGSGTEMIALNPETGKQIWTQAITDGATVCMLTSSQLVVLVNDQLAFLDASTGQQVSYETDHTTDVSGEPACPMVLAGGVSGLSYNSQSLVVTQLASP